MQVSSATRSLLGEALSWIAGALLLAAGITHLDELRAITAQALALAPAATSDQASPAPVHRKPSGRMVEIRAQGSGHYYATAAINGREIDTLVDTGATMVSLTYDDARRAGVSLRPSDFTGRVSTANGAARVAVVTLDRVEIGGILVRDVQATVSEPGRLATTLLGMSFLSRIGRVDMRQGVLLLAE
jgi:aspartyl protease family protein